MNDAEADSISKDNDFFKKLFGDYSSMSFDSLQKLISQAKQLRAYLSGKGDAKGITFISPDQLKNIEKSPAELEKLKKALDKLLDTGKGGNNKWENIFKTFEKGFAELKVRKEPKRCPAQSVRSAGLRPRRLVNLPICLTRWVTPRLPMP